MKDKSKKSILQDSIAEVTIRGKGGLRKSFLMMTLIPVILMGIVFLTVGSSIYSRALQQEMKSGLCEVAYCVMTYYDRVYPGEYNLLIDNDNETSYLKKGGEIISGESGYIDTVSDDTGTEISIIFYDTRMLSTIENDDGEAIAGTKVNSRITDEVYSEAGGMESFFDGVEINGVRYCADYIPLTAKDGTCVGMIGVARPYSQVQGTVKKLQLINGAVILLTLLVIAAWMIRYTSGLSAAFDRLSAFMGEVAKGHLDTDLDQKVLDRQDEIGDMGRYAIYLRSSLKKLVEKDPLTNLNNRRSGHAKIDQTRKAAEKYGQAYAIAMGDIDFFKKVNDTYGHDAGDAVLKEVARILSDNMAGKGNVIRWGGEEFLFIFDKQNAVQAKEVLWGILQQIRDTKVDFGDQEIRFTMSYGVVDGDPGQSADRDITAADELLYYAKSHGRNRVVSEADTEEVEDEQESLRRRN